MTIIYLLNSLVNGTQNILCEMKYKFYFYQKLKFYLYQKINYIFIENQILSL